MVLCNILWVTLLSFWIVTLPYDTIRLIQNFYTIHEALQNRVTCVIAHHILDGVVLWVIFAYIKIILVNVTQFMVSDCICGTILLHLVIKLKLWINKTVLYCTPTLCMSNVAYWIKYTPGLKILSHQNFF